MVSLTTASCPMQEKPQCLCTCEFLFTLLQLIQTLPHPHQSSCHGSGVPMAHSRTAQQAPCLQAYAPLHKPRAVKLIKRGLRYTYGETSKFLSPWHGTWSALSHALCTFDTKAGWKIAASATLCSTFPWSATSRSWSHVLLLSNTWRITQNIIES